MREHEDGGAHRARRAEGPLLGLHEPSQADQVLTGQLITAFAFGEGQYVSFAERGLL